MTNKYTPFIDSLKTIAPKVLQQMVAKISDPRLQIRAEMWLQVIVANELISAEYAAAPMASLLGLELGCLMKDDLPDPKTGEYKTAANHRDRRSKWVDIVMVHHDWTTWLWLELKAPSKGESKKLKEFLFYDIFGRKIGDTVLNEVDADSSIRLFNGNAGEIMRRNKNLLKSHPIRENYSKVHDHLKAGLLFWTDSDERAASIIRSTNQDGLVITDIANQDSYRLSIIYPNRNEE